MKRRYVGVVSMATLAMASLAFAAGPNAVRKQAEASMLLTGDIVVAPDGSVASSQLDHPDKVPVEIKGLVQATVSRWHFEPVVRDGKPVTAKARMNLRLVAKREAPDSDKVVARVSGATFGDESATADDRLTAANRIPPGYPDVAARSHVGGTVYLVAKVGRDGRVIDAETEQVNLAVVASEPDMKMWRKMLATPALTVLRKWTFNVPTKGPHAADPYYVVRVPVQYDPVRVDRDDTYGKWAPYVPGPRADIAWAQGDEATRGSTDALPDGELQLAGTGLKLTTPLNQG